MASPSRKCMFPRWKCSPQSHRGSITPSTHGPIGWAQSNEENAPIAPCTASNAQTRTWTAWVTCPATTEWQFWSDQMWLNAATADDAPIGNQWVCQLNIWPQYWRIFFEWLQLVLCCILIVQIKNMTIQFISFSSDQRQLDHQQDRVWYWGHVSLVIWDTNTWWACAWRNRHYNQMLNKLNYKCTYLMNIRSRDI